MRLLCIKDSNDYAHTRNGMITIPEHMKVKCGEIYTVAEEVIGYQGVKKWRLVEKPANCRYEKHYFTPLSDNKNLKEDEFELEIVGYKNDCLILKSK
jgi:hypothetical protein